VSRNILGSGEAKHLTIHKRLIEKYYKLNI